ncbi:N-acetylmuramoyl-L-alanine amidase family protein [Enterocloster sp. OA13]|uniref:N-acetylmuramoyl-L-alanine amidase family protein n=1 Tax=Enterocloster sp. OA13 TaxID=2914161 RepID=UPI00046EE29B|nr:N-acetylmuramoyl-L-alanine amidase family protein [Enterocloster sp. OA13]
MKKNRMMKTALGLGTAMTVWMGLCAYGAQSSVIESVNVTFKTVYGEPEEIPEPEITVSGKSCFFGDVQYRTDYDNWKPGRKVRVEVTVAAEDGKYFPATLNRSKCKVTGADFVSAKALDDSSLQVKADYRPVTVLGDTQKAGWSGTAKKKAVWKSVEYAPGYTLTLYGDNKVVKRMTVESNSVNLADYMTDMDKTYYYEVKAVPVTSDEKKYLKEGQYVTSTDQEFDWEDYEKEEKRSQGPGDGGSFKGDNYVMPDGSKAVDTWKLVSGKWYYFDGSGNRVKGWLHTGDRWYYMDQNGAMCMGWISPGDGFWYYLGENGDMLTGWIQPNPGTWYYLGTDGRMQTGWMNDNGTWYYLDSSGSMAVNRTVDGWNIGPDGKASR